MSEIPAGAIETIGFRPLLNGAAVPSATVTARVKRKDGLWLDWADSTFRAFGSVVTIGQTLIADTHDTGHYGYAWNTSTITNAVASDVYAVTIIQTAPFACTVEGEIRTSLVPAVQSGLALASAVATLQSGVTTLLAGVTVAALAADSITGTSIATSAVTKLQAGLATAASSAAAVWATADGASTMGAALSLLRRRATNKRALSSLGILSFFADDGTTVEKTSTVRDVANVLVSPASGEAAQASAEA